MMIPQPWYLTSLSGQAIPAGLHVRMSMQTGEKEAKLMDGDSGMKYWKSEGKEGILVAI